MRVLDPGHLYELEHLGTGGKERLRFIKRNSGAVQRAQQYAGTNTQEVLRVAIDRTKYLNEVLPCVETQDAVYHLRMALFLYEVRAHRRKQQKLNKQKPQHDDTESPNAHRSGYDDIPFTEHNIELLLTGEDGHIIIEDDGEVGTPL